MSKIADDTYKVLKKLYPFDKITKEYYVNYKNTRLFFDYFINSLRVLVECDGEQHYKYISHFHNSIEDFYAQKRRDNLKIEWAEKNDLTIMRVCDKIDIITEELILKRIYEAMNE